MTAPKLDLDAIEARANAGMGDGHRPAPFAPDALALIAELRAARAQIAALLDVASRRVHHTDRGWCPTCLNYDARDPECPACRVMGPA